MSLNIDLKRKSILNCNTNLLVIGGPGSGKTTIALAKAFKYIEDNNLNRGQKVLFLSFSRNAKSRILQSSSNFSEHKKFGKQLYVQTFHAFFLEIIKTHCYLLGSPKKITIIPPHDEDALRLNRNENDEIWVKEKDNLLYMEGKITFDRFSKVALEIIVKSNRIRKTLANTFPLIIVDEAQDTDAEQWEFIKLFNHISQLILLGDLDQQIFDYRPDINPERINSIKEFLSPIEITLESENYRSPNSEILYFARDVLNNTPRNGTYKGVTSLIYSPQVQHRDKWIRSSIGILKETIKRETGEYPQSIAILCPWAKGVKMISAALRAKEINHRVQFDVTETNLSSRMIACLLEPILNEKQHLLWVLNILKDFYSATGKENEIKKYNSWIEKVYSDKKPGGTTVSYFINLINELRNMQLSGNPSKDWRFIQQKLLTCSVGAIKSFASHSEYLIAYNQGKIIMRDLTQTWIENKCYANARGILQRAIVEAQLSGDVASEVGINVMTTYKAKGKEFDGVIIFQNQYNAPLELRGDNPVTFQRSRKLFLVAVTRACHHVFILRQAGLPSPLLDRFTLNGLRN
ncbi:MULTISPECIES: UvrD-helicase domain-containing protein [Aequorivita]|uniref:DNA 3'-5' helicase n=1 Tax=Aequorivita iocasae TaxID=2803865 RepID=A0ABX7DQW4_9FLAO|nr:MULTISPECIES: UvrD-helicase domain-containing protein [Aequorivita]QQX76006.1 ATP-dependent helicase [Aequorivita iocasae]UCA55467.1 UvrD-helicase domain-containing protein [Aequorivita sp. F7]